MDPDQTVGLHCLTMRLLKHISADDKNKRCLLWVKSKKIKALSVQKKHNVTGFKKWQNDIVCLFRLLHSRLLFTQ